MLDNYNSFCHTLRAYRQIQVYADPGPFHRTDQGIIAHCACKRDPVPTTKHPVAYHVLGFVPRALEVFGLVAHANSPKSVPWHQSSTQCPQCETRKQWAHHPRQLVPE